MVAAGGVELELEWSVFRRLLIILLALVYRGVGRLYTASNVVFAVCSGLTIVEVASSWALGLLVTVHLAIPVL